MKNDSVNSLDAIRRLALKDLDATSDEELRSEILAEGGDPEAIARSIANELDTIVAAVMRERALIAKTRIVATPAAILRRPAFTRMKELIDRAFSTDSGLATAFRDGARQSEADLQSLYDDLVALGKIKPEADD